MGYSLGDDKRSFDVYEQTNQILDKLGNKLIENGWVYNEQTYLFSKNNRYLNLDTSQDHVNNLYISDDSIDYKRFCDKNMGFDMVYDSDDNICCVCTGVYENTDVDKLLRNIEYAPLKEKNNDFDL